MFDSLSRAQKLIVCAHVVLALLYGAVIPPWEAHDETGHFAYINHIVTQRELPRVRQDSRVFLDQSHQPQLYYLIVSALTFWVDRSDNVEPQINTFAFDGSNRRGARIVLRTTGEAFPWRGTVLALHAARVVSALLSGLMLLLIAKTAALLFAGSPGAANLATTIAAFNPQALFMAGMVNNDVLISLIGSALLLTFASLVSASEPLRHSSLVPRSSLVIGLLLGLGLLAKRTSFGLIGFAVVALLYLAWRQRWTLAQTAGRIALSLGTMLLVASPYFVRNLMLYGQLIADRKNDSPILQPSIGTAGIGLLVASRDGWLPQIFINGFRTFWGTFGWGNLQLPDWAYTAFLVFTVIGIVGFIVAVVRPNKPREILIGLALFFFSMVLLPLFQAIFYQNPQLFVGRYLMPALGAFACMVAAGWERLEIRDWRLGTRFSISNLQSLISFFFALITPFAFITPAYTTPISQSNQPALLTFEDVAQVTSIDSKLVYVQDKEGQRPYADIAVTWRALRRTDAQTENFVFGISVLGHNNEVLGQTSVYPGLGNYPSPNWNVGDVFTDRYFVQIEKPCAVLPTQARVSLGLFTMALVTGPIQNTRTTREVSVTRTLKPLDGEGRETTPILGAFRIEQTPPVWKFWQEPMGITGGIWLRQRELPMQAAPGSTLTVKLAYEPAQANNPPATAFVHLLDAKGERVAQRDQPPQSGFYPTHLWVPGECVRETFMLSIPLTATGTLRAVTGFYGADGIRFTTPITTDNDVVELGLIEIKP